MFHVRQPHNITKTVVIVCLDIVPKVMTKGTVCLDVVPVLVTTVIVWPGPCAALYEHIGFFLKIR